MEAEIESAAVTVLRLLCLRIDVVHRVVRTNLGRRDGADQYQSSTRGPSSRAFLGDSKSLGPRDQCATPLSVADD